MCEKRKYIYRNTIFVYMCSNIFPTLESNTHAHKTNLRLARVNSSAPKPPQRPTYAVDE